MTEQPISPASEPLSTALLVVDMQVGVVEHAHDREQVLANIAGLVDRARLAAVPIVWVQHFDDDLPKSSPGWRYVDELQRTDSELLIHKQHGDSFEGTTLDDELRRRGIDRVVVVGAQTEFCIRATIHGAFTRGYDTILVGDAHTTDDLSVHGQPTPDKVIAHTNMYWGTQTAPGRRAAVAATADVSF